MPIPKPALLLLSLTFLTPMIWPPSAFAQQRTLSIKDVLALMQTGQPQLQAYREQSLLMPLSGPVFASSSNTLIPGTALTALLQWTPLTFGQRAAAVERAAAQFKLAGSNYDNALFQQRYAAILVYLDIIYLQKLLASQQANIDRTQTGLQQSLVLTKEGLRPGLDSVQFQSLYAQAIMERLGTQRQYHSQVLELCRLTGLPATPDDLSFSDSLMAAQLPMIPDTTGAYTQNPAYRYQHAQVALSAANLKQAETAWRPKLDVCANAYSRGSGIAAATLVTKATDERKPGTQAYWKIQK